MSLQEAITDAVSRALQHISRARRQQLEPSAQAILRWSWGNLIREGHRLLQESGFVCRRVGRAGSPAITALADTIHGCIRTVADFAARVAPPARARGEGKEKGRTEIKIGVANPSNLGCTHGRGGGINWAPLVGQSGAVPTMQKLRLDLLGLPGARIPTGLAAPSLAPWRLTSRGGSAFGSCAAVWPRTNRHIAEIPELGSSRRIWLHGRMCSRGEMHIGFVSLPASTADSDREWLVEIEGLSHDLAIIRDKSRGLGLRNTIIMGDFNMQPDELGGGREPRRKRQAAWERQREEYGLVLHNPCVQRESKESVWLPKRRRYVCVHPGSTRWDEKSCRAIDLVESSGDVVVEVTIHNRVHCCRECDWDMCPDFAGGDHFMVVATITDDVLVENDSSNTPVFPGAWHDKDRWAEGFGQVDPALQAIKKVLLDNEASWCAHGQDAQRVDQWLADSGGWLIGLVAALVRDAWVHPATTNHIHTAAPAVAGSWQNMSQQDPIQLAYSLKELLSKHGAPTALTMRCFKWLKPKLPVPMPEMICGDKWGSIEETHAEWCRLVQEQCLWPESYDEGFHEFIMDTMAAVHVQARSARGQGATDQQVTEQEVAERVAEWDNSPAMPPDLIPRACHQCRNLEWRSANWAVQKLVGPGALARRPRSWRGSLLYARYKKGDEASPLSFRYIFVKIQFGLLQEGMLAARIAPRLRRSLEAGQSGFVRGTEDPHLAVHEISAAALAQGRCVWTLMGDFVKAFPKTWRELVLFIMSQEAGIDGGCLASLCSILEDDEVAVWLSGCSKVRVASGIPEGGSLGPVCYTSLPNDLVRELKNGQVGIGIGITMPAAWRGYKWSGCGTPIDSVVDTLVGALRQDRALPSTKLMKGFPDLEASALRALDLTAPRRVAAVLHCDDPVFLASSRGALQHTLNTIASWCFRSKARMHATKNKSVVTVVCAAEVRDTVRLSQHLVMPAQGDDAEQPITYANQHRWLGILWNPNLDLSAARAAILAMARETFSVLSSLVAAKAVPLPIALDLVEAKVDGLLEHSRWLLAVQTGSELAYDEIYDGFACELLGADRWRNASVASAELGWCMSGSGRAVRSVAMRAVRLMALRQDDWYRSLYEQAQSQRYPESWAVRSLALMSEWGINLDVTSENEAPVATIKQRIDAQIVSRCHAQWLARVVKHQVPIPYLELSDQVTGPVAAAKAADLPWDVLIATRAWARLRCGYIDLAHREGHYSQAIHRQCLFCSVVVKQPLYHCLGRCPTWSSQRAQMCAATGVDAVIHPCGIARAFVRATPGSDGFTIMARWAAEIEEAAEAKWRSFSLSR